MLTPVAYIKYFSLLLINGLSKLECSPLADSLYRLVLCLRERPGPIRVLNSGLTSKH